MMLLSRKRLIEFIMKSNLVFFFILCVLYGKAQNVTNLDFKLQGDEVIVTYDLDQDADIYLFAQIDEKDGWNTSFMNYSAYRYDAPALRAVTGDVGKRVIKGKHKQIIWKYQTEVMPFFGGKSESGLISNVVYLDKKGKVSRSSTNILNALQIKIEAYPSTFEPDMVYIDGCDGSGNYWIGRYEVTIEEFAAFIEETGYITDAEKKGYGEIWSRTKNDWEKKKGMNWRCDESGNPRPISDYGKYPVVNVSHNDAMAYCDWLYKKYNKEYLLPCVENWLEIAQGIVPDKYLWIGLVNGTGEYTYSGSNNINEVGWYNSNSDYKIHPIGQKKPNKCHVYDMTGNVNEWCYNYVDEEKQMISKGYSDVKKGKNFNNYLGCGGSCFTEAQTIDVDDCVKYWDKNTCGVNLGFRVVMVVPRSINWITGEKIE